LNFPPITLSDLSFLLVINAIVILITAELSSPKYGRSNLLVNKKRLKIVALATVAMFLITVVITIANIVNST
jgi:hypothetical protein